MIRCFFQSKSIDIFLISPRKHMLWYSLEAPWQGTSNEYLQYMFSSINKKNIYLGPVVQSVVSLTSSLRVISLTVLVDSINNILIFFCWKNVSSFCIAEATHIFSAKNFSIFCVSLEVNFNESLTNDVVSFERLGPDIYHSYLDLCH